MLLLLVKQVSIEFRICVRVSRISDEGSSFNLLVHLDPLKSSAVRRPDGTEMVFILFRPWFRKNEISHRVIAGWPLTRPSVFVAQRESREIQKEDCYN